MSIEALNWAWKQEGLSSSEKLVLLCLADNQNEATGRCDPGAKYISKKTCLNLKTIPSTLKKLSEKNLIAVIKRTGTSPQYDLNLTQYWGNPKTGLPKNGSTQKRIEPTPKTGEGGNPKTGDKPSIESLEPLKHKSISLESLPAAISHESAMEWIDHRHLKNAKPTQKAFDRAMENALKPNARNLTPDEVVQYSIDRGWTGIDVSWIKSERDDANTRNPSAYQQRITKLADATHGASATDF